MASNAACSSGVILASDSLGEIFDMVILLCASSALLLLLEMGTDPSHFLERYPESAC